MRDFSATPIFCYYVCMFVRRQRAALGPLWYPQPTFRFEGHIGDIHVKRTAQAGELYNRHALVMTLLEQVINPVSMHGINNIIITLLCLEGKFQAQQRTKPGSSPIPNHCSICVCW